MLRTNFFIKIPDFSQFFPSFFSDLINSSPFFFLAFDKAGFFQPIKHPVGSNPAGFKAKFFFNKRLKLPGVGRFFFENR